MREVDLHLHTTFSDGTLSPTELVQLCAKNGLKTISITDHDSTEGVEEAIRVADNLSGLTVIPGVELSTDVPGSEIHLLGYFVQYHDPQFQRVLHELRNGRNHRAQEMVKKLHSLGIDISWKRVKEISADGAIGRPHIAQAMVEKEYVKYPRDAFDKYLGRNGAAYVERMKLTPIRAVEMLVENGAVPVMAHPSFYTSKDIADQDTSLRKILNELKHAGLVGLEVHYGGYSIQQIEKYNDIANELGLIPCGGSDYHASGNPNEPEPGSAGPPMSTVTTLKSQWRRRRATTTKNESSK